MVAASWRQRLLVHHLSINGLCIFYHYWTLISIALDTSQSHLTFALVRVILLLDLPLRVKIGKRRNSVWILILVWINILVLLRNLGSSFIAGCLISVDFGS